MRHRNLVHYNRSFSCFSSLSGGQADSSTRAVHCVLMSAFAGANESAMPPQPVVLNVVQACIWQQRSDIAGSFGREKPGS